MAGTILHEGNLGGVAISIGAGAQLVQQVAEGVHDMQIGLFVPAADVVVFARNACFEHAPEGAAVVAHMQPVAHMQAITVYRQWLAGQGVDDHQRDEFFGKLVGAVVVAAMGDDGGHAVCVVPGAHQMITGGLAGAVRAVGSASVCFGKGVGLWLQAAIHLIRGDMQKAEGSPVC